MTFDKKVIDFYFSLKPPVKLPSNIEILNPFTVEQTRKVFKKFYQKFYHDSDKRVCIFGINPGRFGAGVTGVSFTDPIRLEDVCGIKNDFMKKPELSSQFVYKVIDAYGGVKGFYHHFYVTAISPLGFTQDGKNLNYYDDKKLLKAVEPFIVDSIKKQLQFGVVREVCLCLGEGKNFEYFSRLNEQHKFFSRIIALPHPRWVMQYRRKRVEEYVKCYLEVLKSVC